MRLSRRNVGKSENRILDIIGDKFTELGSRFRVSKTLSKFTLRGYGVKISRETETVETTVLKGACDDR